MTSVVMPLLPVWPLLQGQVTGAPDLTQLPMIFLAISIHHTYDWTDQVPTCRPLTCLCLTTSHFLLPSHSWVNKTLVQDCNNLHMQTLARLSRNKFHKTWIWESNIDQIHNVLKTPTTCYQVTCPHRNVSFLQPSCVSSFNKIVFMWYWRNNSL